VAFPGGAEDPEDQTPLDTALREAHEEVGIDPGSVTVIGALRPFDTRVSDFVVHPFVAYLAEPNPVFTPQSFEVDEVLEVPVASLRDRAARHWGLVPGFNVPIPLPYYRIGDTIVWGATGGIVGELLEALDEADAARA
jgi:8-oxo-dGTP pyrophosphatase MutT (NUDIX family)